jgi:hypothetical protein
MHPPEPIYPCYLPVLGEFNRMTPHEGPSTSLPEVIEPSEFGDMRLVRAKKWTCPSVLGGSKGHVPCEDQGLDIFGLCPVLVCWGGHVQLASANRSLATS